MDHDRQIQPGSQFELGLKRGLLLVVRHALPVVVQTDLADGHDLWMLRQFAKLGQCVLVEAGCVVGMHPDLRVHAGVTFGQFNGPPAAVQVSRRIDNHRHTGIGSTLQHVVAVGVELVKI